MLKSVVESLPDESVVIVIVNADEVSDFIRKSIQFHPQNPQPTGELQ